MESAPSTSSSSVHPPYHAFINHRGPDTKKTLASLIYHRLTGVHHLRVFLDQPALQTGDALSPTITDAISAASLHIAIFSKGYAESPWCLDELLLMLNSSAKILPVFYDVQPSDLRWADTGHYAPAFHKHEKNNRVHSQTLQDWKNALSQVSHISGEVFNASNDDIGDLLEKIVKSVLKELRRSNALEVDPHPVGLEQALEDLENTLKRGSSNIAAIVGMSGAGKTTLAKHFYNSKFPAYVRSSFLHDVNKTELLLVQRKLIEDLLDFDARIYHTSEGKGLLRDPLRGYPVLIVLDDIDHPDQIDSLLDIGAVRSESLILVTCRDKDVFRSSGIQLFYEVKALQEEHAQELFCWHAFAQPQPFCGFENLVQGFVNICSGLPLSLKVFGRLMRGKTDKTEWKQQLESIWMLPREIEKRLKVAYDALEREEQDIFLDIACFLDGKDRNMAIRIWDGCGLHGSVSLEKLHDKCLVEFVYGDEFGNTYLYGRRTNSPRIIRMHNQLRDLGRQIEYRESIEDKSWPRFWNANDILKRYAQRTTKETIDPLLIKVRGIRLDNADLSSQQLDILKHVCGLNFLLVEGKKFGNQLRSLSGHPVWLRWYAKKAIPLGLSMENLRVLEVKLWFFNERLMHELNAKPPLLLRELNIDNDPASQQLITGSNDPSSILYRRASLLVEFPKSSGPSGLIKSSAESSMEATSSSDQDIIGGGNCGFQWIGAGLNYLEKMVWKNVKILKSFPEEWCSLQALNRLDLNGCTNLKSLPVTFGELRNLRHLDLSDCSSLTVLPNSFCQLIHLQYLSLKHCSELIIPLELLGDITTLEYLNFEGCSKLKMLPYQITSQKSLWYLNLTDTSLKGLPTDLGDLSSLEYLKVGSPFLKTLPHSFGNLSCLTELHLLNCVSLIHIPKSVKEGLDRLEINESAGITGLNLRILNIVSCPIKQLKFKNYPSTSSWEKETVASKIYPSSNRMCYLTYLTVRDTQVRRMCIPQDVCPVLQILDLSENKYLVEVEEMPATVVNLKLKGCVALKKMSPLYIAAKLEHLNIRGCGELENLNVVQLALLEEIKADGCWKLQSIKGLPNLERLRHLQISADNGLIWRDMQTLPSNLSTAVFSARALIFDDIIMVRRKILSSLRSNFEVSQVRLCEKDGTIKKLDPSAVILCYICDCPSICGNFEVQFEFGNGRQTSIKIHNREGQWIHMFIFTKYSDVGRALSFSYVLRAGWEAAHLQSQQTGWIVTVRETQDITPSRIWKILSQAMGL